MITKYFNTVKSEIENYSHIIENYTINEKTYSDKQGFIEGELFFTDASRLEFAEVKNVRIPDKQKYHYHYMTKSNKIIFRYDNSKHFKNLKTYPHHKHLSDKVIESNEPDILNVLSEIEEVILKKD